MKRRKIMVTVLAVLLAILIILPLLAAVFSARAVTQDEIDELQDQADELEQKQQDISNKLDAIADEQNATLAKKELLDERVNTTYEEIENLTARITILDAQMEYRQKELEKCEAEEEYQNELFKKQVRTMEENGTISYYSILFDAASFSDLLSRIDDISEVMSYSEKVAKNLETARLATIKASEELELAKQDVESAKLQQEEKKKQLDVQIADMMSIMQTLESNEESYRLAYDENEAREEELTAQITELQRQYDEQLAEERRKAAEQAAANGSSGDSGGDSDSGSSGVIYSTGSYYWPVNDSRRLVTSPFGMRYHPVLHENRYHSGIDIGTWYGCEIFAADSGVVTTATYSSGYGNYVMIAHGDGRYTLYGHMSSIACTEGESVSQGEVIGYVGSTGMSTGNHLHFEIWINGSRVDPLAYFSNYTRYWD